MHIVYKIQSAHNCTLYTRNIKKNNEFWKNYHTDKKYVIIES